MTDIVERLSNGRHKVVLRFAGEGWAGFKEAVGRGYIHVRFEGTRGGTEIGIRLAEPTSHEYGDETSRSLLRLVGITKLDYVPVECTVEVDPATFVGEGWLRPIDNS